jgi:hypothetical protein
MCAQSRPSGRLFHFRPGVPTNNQENRAKRNPVPNQQSHHTVEVFDTTLRDGLQVEGVSATVDDKLRIDEQLDNLVVHFI